MNTIEKLESMISGMQTLVDFLKQNKELADAMYVYKNQFSISCWGDKAKDNFKQMIRKLAKGKRLKKEYTDYSCKVERLFSDYCSLEISIKRERICEKKVIGMKTVAAINIPEHQEEIVEWVCK